MSLDFNNDGPQRSFDALPSGTLCKVGFAVKAGGQGTDGVLTQSKKTAENKQLVLECTIISAPHTGRKLFEYWIVEGNQQSAEISRSKIRALINSCRGIDPNANDPASAAGRVLNSYGDVHGMVAACRLSFTPAKDGYEAKNNIATVVEPGDVNYNEIMAGQTIMPTAPGGAAQAQAPAAAGWAPPAAAAPAQAQAPAQQQMWAPPGQQAAQPVAQPQAQPQWTPPAAGQPAVNNPASQPAAQPQEQASASPAWAQQPQQ